MNDKSKLAVLQNSVKMLREMKNLQCSDGNWNFDEYMHGMANGLILALSLFEENRLEYLTAPEKWLKNNTELDKSTCRSAESHSKEK